MSKKFEATQEDLEYANYVFNVAPEGKEDTSFKNLLETKEYPKKIVKGLVDTVTNIAEFSPSSMFQKAAQPIINQLFPSHAEPIDQRKEIKHKLDEALPTMDTPSSNIAQRGTNLFSELSLGGGSVPGNLLRSAAAAGLGEGAKQLGFGETGQAVAELPALLGPELIKMISTKGPQKALAEFARKHGWTEEELSLALEKKGPFKNFLAKLAYKGEGVNKKFQKTRDALGRLWTTMAESEGGQTRISHKNADLFVNEISEAMSHLPVKQRELISADYNELLNSEMAGANFMNFWKDLNYQIAKGEGALGTLKSSVSKAIGSISPELAEDFPLANKLYKNFATLANKMDPTIATELLNAGEAGILLTGVSTGNLPMIGKVIKAAGARKLAESMLTNPRFHNIGLRFQNAVKHRSPVLIKGAYNQMVTEVGKKNSDAAKKLAEFDIDEFIKNLPKQKD